MNRFEKLIEYVINDQQEQARELFHEIVVEKSREIYEEMMDQDDMSEHDLGGDAADDFIQDVEAEEQGVMEDDFDLEVSDEVSDEMPGDHDESQEQELEDRVLRLEDEVDRLIDEFEARMNDDQDEVHGGDELEQDDTAEFGDDQGEQEFGGEEDEEEMMEAVSLKAAPKPTTSEEGQVNKKAVYAANSGQTGMEGRPVKTGQSQGGRHDAPGAYSNKTQDLISDFQNKAGSNMKDPKAATRPHLSQATGVNTTSPVPKGR